MLVKNIMGHTMTILKHKWYVFKLCCRAGIPFRGIIHDLSKFSPTEFWESVKYYSGKRSPIYFCKKENGYSKAWLHHKGRNKHHYEYWFDSKAPEPTPIIPYKYAIEMVCDTFAAGMAYQGKNWTKEYQLSYWESRERPGQYLNPKISAFLDKIYHEVAEKGLYEVINKKNLKKLYYEYTK